MRYTIAMLKKKERLKRKEFDEVFTKGKRLHSPVAQLIYAPGDTFHGAAVVGKKVHKKAVDRNSLRRRLYGLLYTVLRPCSPARTYILIAKPQIAKLSRKEVQETVRELLEKVQTT